MNSSIYNLFQVLSSASNFVQALRLDAENISIAFIR